MSKSDQKYFFLQLNNFKKCQKMSISNQKYPKCILKVSKSAKKYQKVSKSIKKYQKVSKTTEKCQKSQSKNDFLPGK